MRLWRAVYTAVAGLHAAACGLSGSCWLNELMSQVTWFYVIVRVLSQARVALHMARAPPEMHALLNLVLLLKGTDETP
jgi:hypothetical protein